MIAPARAALASRHRAPVALVGVGETLVEAAGVSVVLGGARILEAVDLRCAAGEIVALVGPNGAGKSTLLGVLAGDLVPTAGTVRLDGDPMPAWTPTELSRRRAVLPQHAAVTFPFTVEQVVQMGRAPWARTERRALDDAAVQAALREADVLHLTERHVPSLSGGERARVALARVLAQDTQVLMLDEPTAALDLHHQELVLRVVRERVDRGDGAVVVLHDLGLAAAYADRVVVLGDGRIRAEGTPAAVLRPELLSEVYHHAIEVLEHPETGSLLVLPKRSSRA